MDAGLSRSTAQATPCFGIAEGKKRLAASEQADDPFLSRPWKFWSRRPLKMPVHTISVIAPSALEVLGDGIDGLI